MQFFNKKKAKKPVLTIYAVVAFLVLIVGVTAHKSGLLANVLDDLNIMNIAACPKEKPFKCANGICVEDDDLCLRAGGCNRGEIKCSDGSCVNNPRLCLAYHAAAGDPENKINDSAVGLLQQLELNDDNYPAQKLEEINANFAEILQFYYSNINRNIIDTKYQIRTETNIALLEQHIKSLDNLQSLKKEFFKRYGTILLIEKQK